MKVQLVFLLAFVLLFSTKVSSAEEKTDPVYPPPETPVYPPKKAPAYPPTATPPTQPNGECVPMCAIYCKDHRSKRECQRQCVPCCRESGCVPGQYQTCKWSEEVKHHGRTIKCPEY